MGLSCFHCGKDAGVEENQRVARADSCPHCGRDLKACKNCRFYDPGAYNECRETVAERIVDKERSNFCDFFKIRLGASNTAAKQNDALKNLDDLFKK
jgi:hypothetical protein